MERETATSIFESLSSGVRFDAFRLLVRRGAQGMVAGDIAIALNVPSSNLSFHLKALTQAGLLTGEQEGRFQRYRANTALILDLVAYLTAECCVDSLSLSPRVSALAMDSGSAPLATALASGPP